MGSNTDLCYIQNSVITNRVIKRLRCISLYEGGAYLASSPLRSVCRDLHLYCLFVLHVFVKCDICRRKDGKIRTHVTVAVTACRLDVIP